MNLWGHTPETAPQPRVKFRQIPGRGYLTGKKAKKECLEVKSGLRFEINGAVATGILYCGERFVIDADDVDAVSKLSWSIDKDGYLSHANKPEPGRTLLHRWLMGVSDPRIIVDHANRDRLDCRRANLRIVTPSQNSANHSLFQTNKTGYSGVYYSKCSGRYEVKIGYNHRRILLGSSKDESNLVTLAQMYNIGASFFFGDYAGALNDVPSPSDELVRTVTSKCQKYMKAPAPASAFVA